MKAKSGSFPTKPQFLVAMAVRNVLERQALDAYEAERKQRKTSASRAFEAPYGTSPSTPQPDDIYAEFANLKESP